MVVSGWKPVLVSLVLLVASACGSTGSGSSGTSTSVASLDTASTATSTAATAVPVGTDSGDDEAQDDSGMILIEPLSARPGESIRVTAFCDDGDDGRRFVASWASPTDLRRYLGSRFDIRYTGSSAAGAAMYEATVVVPYWLEPGRHPIVAECGDPVEVEILPPIDRSWDDWRPVAGPWLSEPLPAGAFEEFGTWEAAVVDGDEIHVEALCAHPDDGARFVVWQRYYQTDPNAPDDAFSAVEYAAKHDVAADGTTTISASFVVDVTLLAAPDLWRSPLAVSALCRATSTPFEPDAEPPPEYGLAPILLGIASDN